MNDRHLHLDRPGRRPPRWAAGLAATAAILAAVSCSAPDGSPPAQLPDPVAAPAAEETENTPGAPPAGELGSDDVLQTARALLAEGRVDDAEAALREHLAAFPEDTEVLLGLGRLRARRDDLGEAIELFQRGVNELPATPEYAPAWRDLAMLHERRGDTAAAIATYRRALELDPGSALSSLRLASALATSGALEEALPHFRRAVEGLPAEAGPRLSEAAVLVGLGRWADAARRLEEAQTALPDNRDVTHALARILALSPDAAVRDPGRSLALAEALMEESGLRGGPAETTAMALAAAGRFDEAIDLQRRLVETAATSDNQILLQRLRVNLERYERGEPARP